MGRRSFLFCGVYDGGKKEEEEEKRRTKTYTDNATILCESIENRRTDV